MDSDVDFRWSSDVCHARWIADHLAPFDSGLLASVVPGGFESYARLLHPAEDVRHGERLVRWADVAAWSGAELVPGTQFHEIAIPEEEPKGPAPWRGQGPREGTLCAGDAAAAVEVLQEHPITSEHCWFCLWDGLWAGRKGPRQLRPRPLWYSRLLPRVPACPGSDPCPSPIRSPRRPPQPGVPPLRGPISAVRAFVDSEGQTPNLWWPQDRAWCVASEIDLPWTYVGESAALVASLLAEPWLEAQRATEGESCQQEVTGWLAEVIEAAVTDLLESGATAIETSRGTVRAELERPRRWGRGCLRTSRVGRTGATGGSTWMLGQRDEELRAHVSGYLASAVIDLVGG